MLGEFKLGLNAAKATKTCSVKDEGAVDFVADVSRNLDWVSRSDRPKIVDSEAVLQVMETNSVRSSGRLSAELVILLSNVILHLHNLDKSIRIVHPLTEYGRIFDSALYLAFVRKSTEL